MIPTESPVYHLEYKMENSSESIRHFGNDSHACLDIQFGMHEVLCHTRAAIPVSASPALAARIATDSSRMEDDHRNSENPNL